MSHLTIEPGTFKEFQATNIFNNFSDQKLITLISLLERRVKCSTVKGCHNSSFKLQPAPFVPTLLLGICGAIMKTLAAVAKLCARAPWCLSLSCL